MHLRYRDHGIASPKRVLPRGQTRRRQEPWGELAVRDFLAHRVGGQPRKSSERLAAKAVLCGPRAHLLPPITVGDLALRSAGVVGDSLPTSVTDRETGSLELRLALQDPLPPL